ncbi:carboxylesterase/lipase family protein [Mangrovimonas sp. DI 80]|uniref:carboxylesterase/lipase family protein n=1 Tax=Mangrovimonas sp. DI 80 TaxID=1779330 RepID=UPI000975437D|nr:carboxylesterase family protein [Mangrovimonas sp. DI 80]OMP32833.1 carboxylesterase [Mangrovimonas sp. DI 80]
MYYNRRNFLKLSSLGLVAVPLIPQLVFPGTFNSSDNIIANTAYGKIKGYHQEGVSIFKGVPYAGKVSGERRFLTPDKLKPWTGIKDATQLGPPSIQTPNQTFGINEPAPAEDCLVLNIWTPETDYKKRPVMVYNHGGGYNNGSGGSVYQDGANLARYYDVVVVETNHRLGLLGFLYLDHLADEDYQGSGNRGVQDIAIALKWVKENIAEFGGDPDNVMIFGESGGGMKTTCLYAMPEAAPYFNKASIESGPGVILKTSEDAAITTDLVLKELGIASKDWRKLLDLSAQELLQAQLKIQSLPAQGKVRGGFMGIGGIGTNGFGAVVDGTVLPHHPFEPTAVALSKDKPLMVGWNEDEYIFFAMFGGDTSVFNLSEAQLQEKLNQEFGDQANKILAVYKETNPGKTPSEIYIAIRSILFMGLGSVQIAEKKAAQGGAPVYLYNFGYKSEVKVPGTDVEFGAMHALDIPFKFYNVAPMKDKSGNESTGMAGNRPERFQAADNMAKLWTSFAKNGIPQAEGIPSWESYNLKQRPTMRIDASCEIIYNRFQKEINMWREVTKS